MAEQLNIKKRDVLAQDIMDLHYQSFKDDNEGFFEIDFFERQVDYAYTALLDRDFREMYNRLRRESNTYFDMVSFDALWLRKEKVKVEQDKDTGLYHAKLEQKPYVFLYDQSTIGIQDVVPVKPDECSPVRSHAGRSWKNKHVPETNHVFWWPDNDGIFFSKKCCTEVFVYFVPGPNADLEISGEKAFEIQGVVLNVMNQARSGTVIDQTNDSNMNKMIQNEVNKEQAKQ